MLRRIPIYGKRGVVSLDSANTQSCHERGENQMLSVRTILFAAIAVLVAACTQDPKFIGRWEESNVGSRHMTLEFLNGNTVLATTQDGVPHDSKYTVTSDGRVIISMPSMMGTVTLIAQLEGDELVVPAGPDPVTQQMQPAVRFHRVR